MLLLCFNDFQGRERNLFDIKENVAEVTTPVLRPLMGLSCDYCTSSSRVSISL